MAKVLARASLTTVASVGLVLACTSGEAGGGRGDASAISPAPPDVASGDAAPAPTMSAAGDDASALGCRVRAPGPLADAATPSFMGAVFPLLNDSCGRFSCHNDAFRTSGLFLGPSPNEYPPDAASAAKAYASLLEMSRTAPALARIEPGDPERSFLMLKVDGCQAALGIDCPASTPELPCGSRMPPASDPWPADKRDVIRTWIVAGAPGP